ncbi:hypothetical protein OIV83_002535 [Microbotryomycetes sp. JL201]|nr:hypothetical protein OIV83_002535 [Microbotryomycetes sp. JL201]
MGTSAPTSVPALPLKKATASGATASKSTGDKWANYSTPEQLGFAEDPDVVKFQAEQEKRRQEGLIGEWQRVAPPPHTAPSSSRHVATSATALADEQSQRDETVARALAEEQEQDRPTTKRWLQEKSVADADSEWDPSKVGPIQVKRKAMTLNERQEKEEKERLEQENKKIKRELRSDGQVVKTEVRQRGGWQQVDTTADTEFIPQAHVDPKPEPDERSIKDEAGAVKTEDDSEKPATVVQNEDQNAKPDIKPVVPSTGFKKRKMHGGQSAAIRRK